MGSTRREGHLTEPERKPCPKCGKDITWTQAGVPRFHKCEPPAGFVTPDPEPAQERQFKTYVDVFDSDLLAPGVMIKWRDIDETLESTDATSVEGAGVFVEGEGNIYLTFDEIEFVEDRKERGTYEEQPAPEPAPLATAPTKVTADVVIAKYIGTRDELETLKKAYDASVADLKALQEKREGWLKGELERQGLTSFKTVHGTCFVDWKDSATVADAPKFLEWVHDDWDERKTFLENRVSKTAVKQRLEDGETPPPGVNYTKVKDVKIRRV